VAAGETLWNVSQQYGVQMKKLRRYNRLRSNDEVTAGTTLWLSSKKPKDAGNDIHVKETVEVNNRETFAWSADGDQTEASISKSAATPIPAVVEVTPVVENKPKNDIPGSTNANDSSETLQPQNIVTMVPDSSVIKSEVVAPPKGKNHVVQPGETLYGIAHTHNVGVMDLVQWNSLNLQDGIKPGQVLKLSESQSIESTLPEQKEIQHKVKSTDTLYGIARKYGVTIKELMEWNNKKDFSLSIGEKLKVLSR
jgi:membrane-bound lytic murein transglycosylase D